MTAVTEAEVEAAAEELRVQLTGWLPTWGSAEYGVLAAATLAAARGPRAAAGTEADEDLVYRLWAEWRDVIGAADNDEKKYAFIVGARGGLRCAVAAGARAYREGRLVMDSKQDLVDEIERLRVLSQNNANSWDAIVRERDALRAAFRDLLHAIGHDRKDLIDEAADRARHALGERLP